MFWDSSHPLAKCPILFILTVMPKIVDHVERRAAALDELNLDRVRLVDVARCA